MSRRIIFTLIFFVCIMTACTPQPTPVWPTVTPIPTSTATPLPTVPTSTVAPTFTPEPTITSTLYPADPALWDYKSHKVTLKDGSYYYSLNEEQKKYVLDAFNTYWKTIIANDHLFSKDEFKSITAEAYSKLFDNKNYDYEVKYNLYDSVTPAIENKVAYTNWEVHVIEEKSVPGGISGIIQFDVNDAVQQYYFAKNKTPVSTIKPKIINGHQLIYLVYEKSKWVIWGNKFIATKK